MFQVKAVAQSTVARQVGMKQYIISQTVACNRVVLIVGPERLPVVVQLLGAKHQYALVAVLVILDNGKGGERLTQAYGVGKDAAVILFELVDDGQGGILLEVIEFVPYDALLETRALVGQHILVDVVKKLIEDVV